MTGQEILLIVAIVGGALAICVSIGTLIGNAVNHGKTLQRNDTMEKNIEILFELDRKKEKMGVEQIKILAEIQNDMKWLKEGVEKLDRNFTDHTKGA
jgi:hypothetical protein